MTRRGFALTEVIVALLVAGTAVTASYGALAMVLDIRDRVAASARAELSAAEMRRMITEWLRDAYVDPGRVGMRYISPSDDPTSGSFVFSTTAARPVRGGEARITLYVDSVHQARVSGLVARFEGLGPRETMELNRDVDGMTVRFLSAADHRWVSFWNSTAELPAAIELRLSVAQSSTASRILALPILVVLDGER